MEKEVKSHSPYAIDVEESDFSKEIEFYSKLLRQTRLIKGNALVAARKARTTSKIDRVARAERAKRLTLQAKKLRVQGIKASLQLEQTLERIRSGAVDASPREFFSRLFGGGEESEDLPDPSRRAFIKRAAATVASQALPQGKLISQAMKLASDPTSAASVVAQAATSAIPRSFADYKALAGGIIKNFAKNIDYENYSDKSDIPDDIFSHLNEAQEHIDSSNSEDEVWDSLHNLSSNVHDTITQRHYTDLESNAKAGEGNEDISDYRDVPRQLASLVKSQDEFRKGLASLGIAPEHLRGFHEDSANYQKEISNIAATWKNNAKWLGTPAAKAAGYTPNITINEAGDLVDPETGTALQENEVMKGLQQNLPPPEEFEAAGGAEAAEGVEGTEAAGAEAEAAGAGVSPTSAAALRKVQPGQEKSPYLLSQEEHDALPDYLFHATGPDAAAKIQKEGIKPADGEHTYLGANPELATKYGQNQAEKEGYHPNSFKVFRVPKEHLQNVEHDPSYYNRTEGNPQEHYRVNHPIDPEHAEDVTKEYKDSEGIKEPSPEEGGYAPKSPEPSEPSESGGESGGESESEGEESDSSAKDSYPTFKVSSCVACECGDCLTHET